MECFLLYQSQRLIALYSISFGYSRHVPSCFLLQQMVYRLVRMVVCVLSSCNIALLTCAVPVWAFL